jgi:hypothetical protein
MSLMETHVAVCLTARQRNVRFRPKADIRQYKTNVRFGSKADICAAKRHVRFTPNSDRKSGFPHKVMSALPPKADMCGATTDVRFGPKADMNDMSACAATAGERGVSGSAFAPRIQRRSTGSDCKSRDCPPKYCLCYSSLGTSDTGKSQYTLPLLISITAHHGAS